MPANLTPQYLEAETKYKQARSPEDKMSALQEMLRNIPKHKGTEKLQADIKRKMAEQKKSAAKKGSGPKKPSHHVDKQGNPQIVVIGTANSGKSQLVSSLSGAELKIADYPFTTIVPQPVMMQYDNVRIQVVDLPPISATHMESWLPEIIRQGDAALLVVDLANDDILDEIEIVLDTLRQNRIFLNEEPEELGLIDTMHKTVVIYHKSDIEGAEEIIELINEVYGEEFADLKVSSTTGDNIEELKRQLFLSLGLIRIYTRSSGKEIDRSSPFLLKTDSTITDLAAHIHQDFVKTLRGGKIWGNPNFTDGQQIARDYVLSDEDIIEILA